MEDDTMAKGQTYKLVVQKSGKAKSVACPMLKDEYLRQAARDCVIEPGISQQFKDWVAWQTAKASRKAEA